MKAAKEAVGPLNLVPIEVTNSTEDIRFLLQEDLEAFQTFKAPSRVSYSLLSSIDSMFLLRRDIQTLLAVGDESKTVASEKGPMVLLGSVADLPSHAILANGQLVGLWEFDPDTETIAWKSFIPRNKSLEKAVKETESFARDQLGDVRSFSLDSAKSRAPRIVALRRSEYTSRLTDRGQC